MWCIIDQLILWRGYCLQALTKVCYKWFGFKSIVRGGADVIFICNWLVIRPCLTVISYLSWPRLIKCVNVCVSYCFSVGSFAIFSQPATTTGCCWRNSALTTLCPSLLLVDIPGSENDTLCASFHDLLMILGEAEACRRQATGMWEQKGRCRVHQEKTALQVLLPQGQWKVVRKLT